MEPQVKIDLSLYESLLQFFAEDNQSARATLEPGIKKALAAKEARRITREANRLLYTDMMPRPRRGKS